MKKYFNYKAVFLVITVLFVGFFYLQGAGEKEQINNDQSYVLEVLEKDSLWIYEVYEGTSLLIRQEYIPAVKGRQGFKTKEDAQKIGNLVLDKLSENKMPAISIEDLNANAISYNKI
ncbi:MAG: DUF4907 domain-containing protein [Winogradskyella arenosi]